METRQIKFRAWDSQRKKMFYEFPDEYIPSIDYGTLVIGTGGAMSDYYELELMQFTGLKDKNGKEIYEGDIVESNTTSFRSFNSAKVAFQNGAFHFVLPDGSLVLNIDTDCYCVIGNIYERLNQQYNG